MTLFDTERILQMPLWEHGLATNTRIAPPILHLECKLHFQALNSSGSQWSGQHALTERERETQTTALMIPFSSFSSWVGQQAEILLMGEYMSRIKCIIILGHGETEKNQREETTNKQRGRERVGGKANQMQ